MTLPTEHAKIDNRDIDLIKTLRFYCERFNEDTFTADTFYMLGLDRFLKNPKKEVGLFFAKLAHHDLAKNVGWTRSKRKTNRNRQIQEYEWTGKKLLEET